MEIKDVSVWGVNLGFTESATVRIAAQSADEAIDIAVAYHNQYKREHDKRDRTHVSKCELLSSVVVKV